MTGRSIGATRLSSRSVHVEYMFTRWWLGLNTYPSYLVVARSITQRMHTFFSRPSYLTPVSASCTPMLMKVLHSKHLDLASKRGGGARRYGKRVFC